MVKATVSRDINFGADKVWAVLADFGNLSWVEGPEKVEVIGEGMGQIRRLFIPGMDPFDEVLEAIAHSPKTLGYSIPKNAVIPFDNYHATVVVSGDEASSHIDWSCELDNGAVPAADAQAMMEGNYTMLLDALEKTLG